MSEHQHTSQDDVSSDKWDALVGDLLDAQLTRDQHTQLLDQLREDSAACENFARQMALQAMLEAELSDLLPPLEVERLDQRSGGRSQETEQLQPAERSANEEGKGSSLEADAHSTPRSKSFLQWASRHPKGPAIAIAATLLIAALVVMGLIPMKQWITERGRTGPEERESDNNPDFVAKLSSWHNDVWLDGTRPPRDDPRLKIGRRLKIKSGLIEVTYLTGAKVVIEGPAEFVIGRMKDEGGRLKKEGGEVEGHPSSLIPHPSNAGFLRLGSLVARVEGKKAQGFAIDTPLARVEDFGTEFGVEVNRSGDADIVVLSGEVDVVREAAPGVVAERVRLTKDQGALVERGSRRITRRAKVDARLIVEMRERLEHKFAQAGPLQVGGLLVNGGFEANGGHNTADADGWINDDAYGVFDERSSGRANGPAAGNWAFVPGAGDNTSAGAYQVLANPLAPGKYRLEFDANPWRKGNGNDIRIGTYSGQGSFDDDASWARLSLGVVDVPTNAPDSWQRRSYTFTATGGEDTVYFGTAAIGGNNGVDIDNVSLTTVSEASAGGE